MDPIQKLTGWDWLSKLDFPAIILRVFLAVLCGAILGAERSTKHKTAGFRTYILVCLGSTVAMMTNQFLFEFNGAGDAARLGAQVISGIGFLGAGAIIITSRNQIKGLTTAASIWACACLGLAIGIGFYTLSILGIIVLILVLAFLPRLEKKLISTSLGFDVHIEFETRRNLRDFLEYARGIGLKIFAIERDSSYAESGLSVYSMCCLKQEKNKKTHSEYIDEFKKLSYVVFVEEVKVS